MSTSFSFMLSSHLCSVSNLRIFLVFQLRNSKVGFSGPKTFLGAFEKRAPGYNFVGRAAKHSPTFHRVKISPTETSANLGGQSF